MSIYLEQIKQLVALQKVDDQIHTIKVRIENAPKAIEELKRIFGAADGQRNYILEKIEYLVDQEKRIGIDIDEEFSRLNKSKDKLMQVSNAKEFQAMSREMDNLEKRNRTREEERIALVEEHRLQEEALEEINARWNALKDELSASEANLEQDIAAANAELDELTSVRSTVGKDIPRPVLERYEFIRRRLAHPVIVPVHKGVCAGCNIAIPPQSYIELQGGHKIINCPNCQRLIYWSEHFSEEKPEQVEETAE